MDILCNNVSLAAAQNALTEFQRVLAHARQNSPNVSEERKAAADRSMSFWLAKVSMWARGFQDSPTRHDTSSSFAEMYFAQNKLLSRTKLDIESRLEVLLDYFLDINVQLRAIAIGGPVSTRSMGFDETNMRSGEKLGQLYVILIVSM